MNSPAAIGSLALEPPASPRRLLLSGDWTLEHYHQLRRQIQAIAPSIGPELQVDISTLGRLDTAGASLLVDCLGTARLLETLEHASHLPEARRALLETVAQALREYSHPAPRRKPASIMLVLERIGAAVERQWRQSQLLLGFVGVILESLARNALRAAGG